MRDCARKSRRARRGTTLWKESHLPRDWRCSRALVYFAGSTILERNEGLLAAVVVECVCELLAFAGNSVGEVIDIPSLLAAM